MDLAKLVAEALIVIWPAYVANATPVVASKLIKRRTPIDMGRLFPDGRRIFGGGWQDDRGGGSRSGGVAAGGDGVGRIDHIYH